MSSTKWQDYYQRGFLPWDTCRPASQLVSYISSCCKRQQLLNTPWHDRLAPQIQAVADQAPLVLPPEVDDTSIGQFRQHICPKCEAIKPKPGAAVLEMGCGTGASSIWLASLGYRVTGIDIVQAAVDKAAATAAQHGLPPNNPKFIQHDIFDLPTLGQTYDMIYDCQVYHALVNDIPEARSSLPQLLFDQLNPGGLLFLLTGNANEPEIGPSVLTAEQLLVPLLSVGFELVLLNQSRFDSTDHYVKQLKKRPLAWWVVLQRPAS